MSGAARNRVFVSYSHKDKVWLERLKTHLAPYRFDNALAVWTDEDLSPGDLWFEKIKAAVAATKVAVFLLSPNFMASDFIRDHELAPILKAAEGGEVRIIWIPVGACAFDRSGLLKYQAACDYKKPLEKMKSSLNSVLTDIAREIHNAFTSPADLSQQLPEVAAGQPSSVRTYLYKLPMTTRSLFGRDTELGWLDKAWEDRKAHIILLHAWGGVGKTALVDYWLGQLWEDDYRGAQRVYGWSFYSQGTREDTQASADTFLAHALGWFGDPDPTQGTAWEKGERLAELVRRQKTLLILDGLEPLQHPPGNMQGQLRDRGIRALLNALARSSNDWGLCVVTTRVVVPELENIRPGPVKIERLDNLSPEAGTQLLRHLGVQGSEQELESAVCEYEGHALALTLLGRCLAVMHNGDVKRRDQIQSLEDIPDDKARLARRIMKSYEIWLKGKPELDILYLMGLFDRPADGGAVDVLRKEPVIVGLTDNICKLNEMKWQYALQHLRDLRLLDPKDESCPDILDCHPLVREHFGAELKANNPAAWKAAHSRLYEYYRALPEKLFGKFLPDTLEEMEPLFRAVAHGCQAGRYQEALDEVYWKRICRGNEAFVNKNLGAFGADLAALSGFFETPWSQSAAGLTDADKAVVLSWAGFALRALGRLREAREPLQAGLQMRIQQEKWENAARAANNLSELSLTLGDIPAAVDYARQSVKFADDSGDIGMKVIMRTVQADALYQAGDLPQAQQLFEAAEKMQQKDQPQYPLLYSLRGYLFCDLLLEQGYFPQVLERANQTLIWVTQQRWLLDISLDNLSLGRANLLQALNSVPAERGGFFTKAAGYLDQAVQGLREAGTQDHSPRGLLARAELYRETNCFADAWRDLAEAQEIAERGEMRLHLADFHLQSAKLFWEFKRFTAENAEDAEKIAEEFFNALPDNERTVEGIPPDSYAALALAKARSHLATAKQMVEQMGYGRRKPAVAELEKALAAFS